jgi:spermidine synthase
MKYSKVNQSATTIVIMGFLSLVSQTLILREIIIQFQGNELTIGIILANWLIFEAIGAYFTGYFIKNKNILKTAVILQIVLIISLIWAYLFISKFKIVFKFGFGESLGIFPTLLIPMIALVFLCIPLGFQFSLSCNILNKFLKFKKGAYNIAHSYFLEAIGWFLGGLVFNFILIYFFNNLQILFIILMLSTANLILYLNIRKKNILRDFFIIILSFLILFLFLKFDIKINKYLNKMNSNYKLLNIEN